ncbi:ABC transporter substrate-binding protein [Leucobacter chinensis]|uniref:ABC transporter substrate-binding protein n=1 Tax=Leucobacter chinensis TaxID=2851010 RepID=UPI001C22FFF6|nr:extracellular solute-binding protein [Leucobacter chinensis]
MKNSVRTPVYRTVAAAAAAALLLGTAACSAGPASPEKPAADGAFPTEGSGVVNLFNFTNYINPETLEKFTEETGIKVNVDTFSSAEEMVAKIKTGSATYDVVTVSDYVAEDLISSGQLLEIDAQAWPNGSNIEDDFVGVYFDDGRKYTTPYAIIYDGIGYDTSVVSESITSWADYFSAPQEARGKIGLHDDQNFVIDAALYATGAERCSVDGADYEKALDLLNDFSPNIKIISSDGTIDRLAGGETVLSSMWNGSFARAKAQNTDLQYVLPTDGFSVAGDNLSILKNAQNPDNAKIFMNWMLDPANAAMNSNYIKYSVPVKGIEEELAKLDDGGATVIVPTADESKNAVIQEPCSPEVKEQYDKLWTMFKG